MADSGAVRIGESASSLCTTRSAWRCRSACVVLDPDQFKADAHGFENGPARALMGKAGLWPAPAQDDHRSGERTLSGDMPSSRMGSDENIRCFGASDPSQLFRPKAAVVIPTKLSEHTTRSTGSWLMRCQSALSTPKHRHSNRPGVPTSDAGGTAVYHRCGSAR